MTVIKVENLVKTFGSIKAVDAISFVVKKGEVVGFLGPNGAGKTTTLRTLMGFLFPTKGTVVLFDDYVSTPSHLREKIGFLPGEVNLYDNWTVREHLEFIARIRRITSVYAIQLSQRFDLATDRKVHKLSSGNKQKLAIIMALMHRPELLLLDEPTNGLDPLLQNSLYELLRQLAEEGTTIFMSSHNLSEVERVCDRVIIIKEGRIVASEHIGELSQKRIYNVELVFYKKPAINVFKTEDTEVLSESDTGYSLKVSGNIAPIIKNVSNYSVRDIQITHANLEEVFLEFYK